MDKFELERQMMLKYGLDFYSLHWLDQLTRMAEVDNTYEIS